LDLRYVAGIFLEEHGSPVKASLWVLDVSVDITAFLSASGLYRSKMALSRPSAEEL
jgi:hypothetical protein